MSVLATVVSLLLVIWYFEADGSVRQMVEDVTGKPVVRIIKKKKNKSV